MIMSISFPGRASFVGVGERRDHGMKHGETSTIIKRTSG